MSKPESAWIIPDDWESETGEWQSFCVQWPKSEKWELLFRSLLYTLARGRSWDRETGTIINAQKIGWEIFERNHDNPGCGVIPCPDCPDCHECNRADCAALGHGGIVIEGNGDEMGQVVTEVEYLGNGILRVYYGKCCFNDLNLASLALDSEGEELGDDPLDPHGDGNVVYNPCGKASAVVDAIKLVLDKAYDAVANVTPFWWVISKVENDVGMNLNNKWVAALVVDWTVYGAVVTPEEVFGSADMQKSKCALESVFSADALGVPNDATYEAVKAAIHTQNLIFDGLVMTAVACLGRSNLDQVAKLGASTEANCLCVGEISPEETEPDASGWYLGINRAADFAEHVSGSTNDFAWLQFTPDHDTYGSFLRIRSLPKGQIARQSQAFSAGGWTPPQSDHSVWGNTSDSLQNANQSYPLISALTSGIRTSLAAQAGYAANLSGGTGGIDSSVIASPEGLGGATHTASIIFIAEDYTYGDDFEVVEFRMVHNVNSPSHTP